MSGWIEWVTQRPVSVGMLTLAAVVFGAVSLAKLPIELLPNISYPTLTIQTELPDAAPEEVEQLVTDEIEPVVGVVGGLKRYRSVSRSGSSEVTLEFSWTTDMALAALDVREKLDLVELPPSARSPIVFRFDPSLDPVLRIALKSDIPIRDLRRIAEDIVKQRLETLEGVAAAKVVGGAEEEVHIEIDEGRLSVLGLTIEAVAARVAEENINRSGGELRQADTAYVVRTIKEFESLADIGETIVASTDAGDVRLREIATIGYGKRDEEIRVRVGGREAVELHVYKEGDANIVDVARRLRTRIDELKQDRRLARIEPEILFDQALFIERSVSNVLLTALIGAALAAVVLFLFLRDVLSTTLVALSIPISVAVTFLLMRFSDISLNVMSLGGLALGIGMLVDNSIVVLEAIKRRREQGEDRLSAVREGTREVFGGVASSTVTTISVFLPLIFVEGIAGQLFRDQALVVTYSLVASLVVSMSLLPSVLSNFGRDRSPRRSQPSPEEKRPTVLQSLYAKSLRSAGSMPFVAPLMAAVLFVAIVPRVFDLGTELVPKLFQGEFYFDIELPIGTPIEVTDTRIQSLEADLEELKNEPDSLLERYFVTVGGEQVLGDTPSGQQEENVARVSIKLRDGVTSREELDFIDRLDGLVAQLPDVRAKLGRPNLFSFRDPIEVEVFSDDLEALRLGTDAVVERCQLLPGFVDVESSLTEGNPEIHVELDPAKLAALNFSRGQIADTLAAKGLGTIPTQYTKGEKPIPIRVVVEGARRGSPEAIARFSVLTLEDGAQVPLSALGDLRESSGPAEVMHVKGERAAVVTARLQGRDLGSAAEDVDRVLSSGVLPPEVTANLSGQHEEMRESLDSLLLALGLAVFMVYLVLASTFESLKLPFLIILTVPLGLIGVVATLWLTQAPVGVLALIGVIMLSGIVVNNGIIYVNRILQLEEGGQSRLDAVQIAGRERFRPILITTLTTILGLLPLAFGIGAGSELRQPLALTVVGGLAVATFLTLYVIPSGFLLLMRGQTLTGHSDSGGEA